MNKQERMDAAFQCFCTYLDSEGLKYQTECEEGDDKRIYLGFDVGSVALKAVFVFQTEAERIYVGSPLPIKFNKDTVDEMVLAALRVNQIAAVGVFCVDRKGACIYESNEAIAGVNVFEPAYAERVIGSTFTVIQKFHGALAAVASGAVTAEGIALKASEEDV